MMDDFAQEVPWAASCFQDSEGRRGSWAPTAQGREKLGAWASQSRSRGPGVPTLGLPGGEAWELDSCVWVWSGPQTPGTWLPARAGLCLSQIATCSSRNGNPAPKIMWYRNGQPLAVPLEGNSGEWLLRELS